MARTKKPFSTISFNTIPFLTKTLIELEQKRVIDFWMFIVHQPEEDEKKPHAHVYMEPNGEVDTDQVKAMFEELDPTNSIPLNCLRIKKSKFDDFYLYNLHDTVYLASKGQSRKLHYQKEEFVVSCEEEFNESIHQIDYSKMNGSRVKILSEYIESKIPFVEIIKTGVIPIQLVKQYEMTYNLLWKHRWNYDDDQEDDLERGERGKTHE